jgi:lipopolysaccharide/colanic/teichoic acid biosynthesis glycosyltransferase
MASQPFKHSYKPSGLALRQSFYMKRGKRALDIFSSSIGLMVLSPAFLVAACCIKLTSPGPVFYRQSRLGKDGRQFQILKFRSMVAEASKKGLDITVSGDSRVTTVGRFLRRYKIDELPQLWNVIRGDMSLVGPRPELPAYVAEYTPEQRFVLSARPGITDPASLTYRDEEEILAGHNNPQHFYRTQILPDKLCRNMSYLQEISLKKDLLIILETVASSLFFCPRKRNSNAEPNTTLNNDPLDN